MTDRIKVTESLTSKKIRNEAKIKADLLAKVLKDAIDNSEAAVDIKQTKENIEKGFEQAAEIAKDELENLRDSNETSRAILKRAEEGNQQQRDTTMLIAAGNRETGRANRFYRKTSFIVIAVAITTFIATVLGLPFLQPYIDKINPWSKSHTVQPQINKIIPKGESNTIKPSSEQIKD